MPKARRSRPQGPARGWESQSRPLEEREAQINAAPDGTRKGNFRTSKARTNAAAPKANAQVGINGGPLSHDGLWRGGSV